MSYSVVIPTNRSFKDVASLLSDLASQSRLPQEIIIVIDRSITKKEEGSYRKKCEEIVWSVSIRVISDATSDFSPWKGAAYVRNQWIVRAKSVYILGIDDDNKVADDFVEQMRKAQKQVSDECVMIPTEYYRKTQVIRSQWYAWFYAWLGWAKPSFLTKGKAYGRLMFCSSNCFRWPTKILQKNPFPEHFWFVAEDFARSTAMTRSGVNLYVTAKVIVRHMMRDKTPLEESYLATEDYAFLKGRNRVRRVRWMSLASRVWYFICGLWVHTLSLLYKIWRYAPRWKKGKLMWALLRWTRVGCVTKK
jgi:glycosyltransferase involved in cell wall biosynthesis